MFVEGETEKAARAFNKRWVSYSFWLGHENEMARGRGDAELIESKVVNDNQESNYQFHFGV